MVVILTARILGHCIANWVFYAMFASVFKHKTGLTIIMFLCLVNSIAQLSGSGNFTFLISTIVSFILICTITPIQVRSQKKAEWKKRRAERKEKNE